MPGPTIARDVPYRRDRIQIVDPDDSNATLIPYALPRALFAAWQVWRDTRAMPDRLDINPQDIPALLGNLVLLDVEADDFRFRLVGEMVARRYATRLKGRSIRALMSGTRLQDTLSEHRQCVSLRRPVLVVNSTERASIGDINTYVRLILPIGNTTSGVSHIIGVMDFFR